MSLTSFYICAFVPAAAAQLRAQEADRFDRRCPQQSAAERRGRRRHQELERGVADLPWRLGAGLVLLGRAGGGLAVVGQDVVEEEDCEDGRAIPHVLCRLFSPPDSMPIISLVGGRSGRSRLEVCEILRRRCQGG